jgi:sec-independent protein translocase protein TatC
MNEIWVKHLLELRRRFIFSIVVIGGITVLLLPQANFIYQLLAAPLLKFLPNGAQLIATDITSPFTVPVKLTFLLALVLSLPHTLFQLWQFIAPGLYKQERKLLFALISTSVTLFIAGMAFCYFIVLPIVFHFIGNFKAQQIAMLTDITNYLNFILTMFTIFGIAFETPIIVFLLIKYNFLSLEQARHSRKYILVTCFILAAVVTPPDVLSQCLLALPLYLLYELGMWAASIAL